LEHFNIGLRKAKKARGRKRSRKEEKDQAAIAGKFLTIVVEKSGGTHACLGASDPVWIAVNYGSIDEDEVV